MQFHACSAKQLCCRITIELQTYCDGLAPIAVVRLDLSCLSLVDIALLWMQYSTALLLSWTSILMKPTGSMILLHAMTSQLLCNYGLAIQSSTADEVDKHAHEPNCHYDLVTCYDALNHFAAVQTITAGELEECACNPECCCDLATFQMGLNTLQL